MKLPPIQSAQPRVKTTESKVKTKKVSIATEQSEGRQETKIEKAERLLAESRKEAKRTKRNEMAQAMEEGQNLIYKDKFSDCYDKQPHRAGRVFKSGLSPL